MILLCGIESEPPLAMVRDALERLGAPYRLFNQRQFDGARIEVEVERGRLRGSLTTSGETLDLESIGSVYTRLMDDTLLPELQGEATDSPRRARCRALHDLLVRWYEIAPCSVVNRTAAMATNDSKPYQAQLIRGHGFAVPETLITNDPEDVREFRNRHRKVVYKSISGVRSIVRPLDAGGVEKLDRIRWCPVQFQEFVEGTNVRVHVVGERLFATEIDTNVTDYRYAHRDPGGTVDFRACELEPDLAARCLRLARSLGLAVAGIDLKRHPDGKVYCFEVNPSPGFSYFEHATGQPIAEAIARYLAGET